MLAIYDWGVLLGVLFFFPIAALLLNYLIYRWALVPRWLSVWGIAGALLLLAEGSLETFDVGGLELMTLPLAVQEMVFAVWLIVRGFDRTEDSPAQGSAVARPPLRA